MKRYIVILCAGLAGCSPSIMGQNASSGPTAEPASDQIRPQARPEGAALSARVTAPPPPPQARTVEEFDTTSVAEREAAAEAPAVAAEKRLGETVASLGDPAKPGFWLETPLVNSAIKGRVEFPGSGKSAQVDLIPIDGPATAGSRISLAAMRLIEAPLTDLPTILVFSDG